MTGKLWILGYSVNSPSQATANAGFAQVGLTVGSCETPLTRLGLVTLLAPKVDYLITGDKGLPAASTPSSRLRNFGHATQSDWMLQGNQPLG
ncbi:hypothetical protein RM96_11000 [Cupriavidus sp. IDO]|nr:hypothetical protein RM96_11000 [Cupriavidus sp. IDO]